MWLSIIGPIGSGKNFVASILKEQGYSIADCNDFDSRINSASKFDQEFGHCLKKMKLHYECSLVMDRENIVSVGDFFWQKQMLLSAFQSERVTREEFEIIRDMMSVWKDEKTVPPSVVVVMKTSKLDSTFRREMANTKCDDFFLEMQNKNFDQFVNQINIPVIEINISDGPEKIKTDLEFNLSSIKSSALGGQRIWKRSYLK